MTAAVLVTLAAVVSSCGETAAAAAAAGRAVLVDQSLRSGLTYPHAVMQLWEVPSLMGDYKYLCVAL